MAQKPTKQGVTEVTKDTVLRKTSPARAEGGF